VAAGRPARERVPTVHVDTCSRCRDIIAAVDLSRKRRERGRERVTLRDLLHGQIAPLALCVRFDALDTSG
jgi:hypothetical protein